MIEDPNYKIMIELLGNSVQEEVILLKWISKVQNRCL